MGILPNLVRASTAISVLVPFVFFTTSRATIFDNIDELPHSSYDFIIVGGGTAGNVMANRLTENPHFSVLVLEAGGSHENVLESIVPAFCPKVVPNTPYDWNFTTTPQPGLNGRSLSFPLGHMLGGSSSINFLAYLRGSSSDWNRYAEITQDKGWSWDSIQPYFLKNEKWTAPADNHNISGQYNPSIHSTRGINSVSLAGFPTSIDGRVIQTTKELTDEFPFNLDMNSGNHLGVGWTQTTINDGRRSSSALSYLAPEFIKRPNLHVVLNTRVTRVLKTNSARDGKPVFRTVEISQSAKGPKHLITASKEVILSAGSVATPTILLHSGIGDQGTLADLGIKSTHHLPDVGRNLTDHPLLKNAWLVNSTDTFDSSNRNASLAAEYLQEWKNTKSGPLVNTPLTQLAWVRLPDNSSIFERFADPASGANTAHIELLFVNGLLAPLPPAGNFLTMFTAVVSPISRGSITLASNDPFAPPKIDPGLLGSEFDIFTMREAVRSALRFISAPAWKNYILAPYGGLANVTTDAELDAYIRQNTETIFHPVGTSSMSPKGAQWGVVDPDLLVKGISGLRIVDASILPIIPAAHTQGPVYAVAERGADLVKESWKNSY